MKITLHPPVCLHEVGQRKNNEDYIYPSKESNGKKDVSDLFLVCDGVGGTAKGEVASRIVCEVFAKAHKNKKIVSKSDIQQALKQAENTIDAYTANNSDSNGMATTFTLLSFHEKGATIAHLGDSRVYQIRDGQIVFRTKDHSFVNELVSNNIITEEEARNHPKRNVVTKAIVGGFSPQEPDIELVQDIRPNDYFFLCTDGILESFPDDKLLQVISNRNLSDAAKMNELFQVCSSLSKDNFSSWLVRVDQVKENITNTGESAGLTKQNRIIPAVIGLVGLFLLGFFIFNKPDKKKDSNGFENATVNIDLDLSNVPDSLARDNMDPDPEVTESIVNNNDNVGDSDQTEKEVNQVIDDLEKLSKELKKEVEEIKGKNPSVISSPTVETIEETKLPKPVVIESESEKPMPVVAEPVKKDSVVKVDATTISKDTLNQQIENDVKPAVGETDTLRKDTINGQQ